MDVPRCMVPLRHGGTLNSRRTASPLENGIGRSNFELYQLYKKSDIANFIKIQRIKWAGHVVRMDEDRTTKKVIKSQPIGTRRKGRPDGLMA
ncbi:uncharacterized protein TNCV_514611 [Trichonephila clavipes]|nr:uncharacterized protein TNCV_514611 [Trichonephila clavipes]